MVRSEDSERQEPGCGGRGVGLDSGKFEAAGEKTR